LFQIGLVASQNYESDWQYDYYDDEEDVERCEFINDLLEPKSMCGDGAKLDQETINNFLDDVNGKIRARVLNGVQRSEPSQKWFPRAEYMMELKWDCNLEKLAEEALTQECTGLGATAFTPEGYAGLYFREDGSKLTYIGLAADAWENEINQRTIPFRSNDFTIYCKDPRVANYYNLMQANSTKIGCGETLCDLDGGKSHSNMVMLYTTLETVDAPKLGAVRMVAHVIAKLDFAKNTLFVRKEDAEQLISSTLATLNEEVVLRCNFIR
ncbi:hypothetical protein OESDEN_12572, partial [Oesophagostomum dentatum]